LGKPTAPTNSSTSDSLNAFISLSIVIRLSVLACHQPNQKTSKYELFIAQGWFFYKGRSKKHIRNRFLHRIKFRTFAQAGEKA
jgi:hypothetical protein